jgi:hypothetical protein
MTSPVRSVAPSVAWRGLVWFGSVLCCAVLCCAVRCHPPHMHAMNEYSLLLSFAPADKRVSADLCRSQSTPRRTRSCPRKPCPRDCVLSAWQWPKKCSTECGAGVRIAHRSVLVPARFGGMCSALNGAAKGLVASKPCFSVKGCTSKRQKREAFKALRARIAQQKAAGIQPPKDPRHTPSADDDTSHVWSAWYVPQCNAMHAIPLLTLCWLLHTD